MKTLLSYLDLHTVIDPVQLIDETAEVRAGKERRALYMIFHNISESIRGDLIGFREPSKLWEIIYNKFANRVPLFDFKFYTPIYTLPPQMFLYEKSIPDILQAVYGRDTVPYGYMADIYLTYRDFYGETQIMKSAESFIKLHGTMNRRDYIGMIAQDHGAYFERYLDNFLHINGLNQYLCLYLVV